LKIHTGDWVATSKTVFVTEIETAPY